jgi:hypothetical protein
MAYHFDRLIWFIKPPGNTNELSKQLYCSVLCVNCIYWHLLGKGQSKYLLLWTFYKQLFMWWPS